MWPTVFVINKNTEICSDITFPAFSKDGNVMLYQIDTLTSQRIPMKYVVDNVIFDVYSRKQYVYLTSKE